MAFLGLRVGRPYMNLCEGTGDKLEGEWEEELIALVGRFPWLTFLFGTEEKGNIMKKICGRGIYCRGGIRRRKLMKEGSHIGGIK